jgi:hypothetical protein
MSDLHRPCTTQKARKVHNCVACGWEIPKGERYTQQEGFYEGRPYRNKYHNECWEELADRGYFEFITGDVEPPIRLIGKR